jgi:YVTN family beta-propeller protein
MPSRRRAHIALFTLAVVGQSLCLQGQAHSHAQAQPAERDWTAYVAANQVNVAGTVTPIDTGTRAPGTPIPVGAVIVDPFGVAITPDARIAYVTERGADQVVRIDTATNTLVGSPIPVGDFPTYLAITPDGTKVYVVNRLADSVSVIDTASNTVTATIPLGDFPDAIAITPDGMTAYVLLRGTPGTPAQIVPIDVATNAVGTSVVLDDGVAPGSVVQGIALRPDGSTAYITDTSPDALLVFDLATQQVTARIPIPDENGPLDTEPVGVAVTPDGSLAFVANQRATASTVTPIDLTTNTALPAIPTGLPGTPAASPFGLAVTPDGTPVYVTNSGQASVSVIDVATRTVVGTPIPVDVGPDVVAITPDQAPDAELVVNPGAAGCAATMDASASTVAFGTIASFAWDFGDGQEAVTTTPSIQHTYDRPGTYTVTVTEISSGGTSIPQITPSIFTGQTLSRHATEQARTTATFTTAASCGPTLPVTGAATLGVWIAGLAAVAGGLALLLVSGIRRRRRG